MQEGGGSDLRMKGVCRNERENLIVVKLVMCAIEIVPMTKRQEAELKVALVKLRFSLGMTRLDEIRNEHIGGTAYFCQF